MADDCVSPWKRLKDLQSLNTRPQGSFSGHHGPPADLVAMRQILSGSGAATYESLAPHSGQRRIAKTFLILITLF